MNDENKEYFPLLQLHRTPQHQKCEQKDYFEPLHQKVVLSDVQNFGCVSRFKSFPNKIHILIKVSFPVLYQRNNTQGNEKWLEMGKHYSPKQSGLYLLHESSVESILNKLTYWVPFFFSIVTSFYFILQSPLPFKFLESREQL